MNEVVAKKYIKAILADLKGAELDTFTSDLEKISEAYEYEKFKNIIALPTLSSSEKAKFLISLIKKPSQKFQNFISLIAQNKRFNLLPLIANGLKAEHAIAQNIYLGKIYANTKLSKEQIKALEDSFSKRFNAKIELEVADKSYNGVKVELNELGVEVSFSVDRLKAQMSEYILKAI